jgi:hypothetical protein
MNFLCLVGERQAWLGFIDEQGRTGVALCNLDNDTVDKQIAFTGSVILTRADDHLVLAQRDKNDRLLCLEGMDIVQPLSSGRRRYILTNKGKLWAVLIYTLDRNDAALVAGVESWLEATDFHANRRAARVPYLDQRPVIMDVTSDHRTMVIVGEDKAVYLYRLDKSEKNVKLLKRLHPDHDKGLPKQVTDVCFYYCGDREMLFLADPTKDDLVVVDFQTPAHPEVLGDLTNRSGFLQHPSALDIHPSTNLLFVACQGRSIVVCGDAGTGIADLEAEKETQAKKSKKPRPSKSPLPFQHIFSALTR